MSIPGSASPLFFQTAAAAAADQVATKSLRFNRGDSAHLSRTPSSASNSKTFTFSCWYKKTNSSATNVYQAIFDANNGSDYTTLYTDDDGTDLLRVYIRTGGVNYNLKTTQVFRDFSAWLHIVLAVDTTQSTAANRIKLYINGSQVTDFRTATYPPQNSDLSVNKACAHFIGGRSGQSAFYLNGYLADLYMVDGLQLDATSFGAFDDNNVWQAAEYSGTFGTNGLHLDFSDATSTTTIAEDSSGNNNDFTANNISVSSGTGNDSMFDAPTNGTQSDTGAGGEVSGNYCTWNPLAREASRFTFANGNLNVSGNAQNYGVSGTLFVGGSGKYYFELTSNSSVTYPVVGIVSAEAVANDMVDGSIANGLELGGPVYGFVPGYGPRIVTQTTTNTWSGVSQSTPTSGDVYGVAVDFDNGAIYFSKNGTFLNSGDPTSGSTKTGAAFTSISAGNYTVLLHDWGSSDNINFDLNAGQRAFAYSAPSGYKALCTTNLPDPTIADGSDYFEAKTFTGTGSSQTISGLEFSPDFVWIKNRSDSSAAEHRLLDTVRGATNVLYSNLTNSESAESQSLTAFTSDGFTVGTGNYVNGSGDGMIAWAWDAGSSTASNTDGSITSNVRASQTAGFSIIQFLGNATSGATVGHGLNAAPELVIGKNRGGGDAWWVWFKAHSSNASKFLKLNTTDAETSTQYIANNTAPSSTVITLGSDYGWNSSQSPGSILYAFTPISGYSAFGSYTGNGSADGPFVYTGFRVAWLLTKRTDGGANNWQLIDATRSSFNVADDVLKPDETSVETTHADYSVDFLSNGFKHRTGHIARNGSGNTYIYAAFASHPFKTARAR